MPNKEGLGAFARHAVDVFNHGLAPIPTGGEDGKRPMLKGYNKKPLAPDRLYSMAADPRFKDCNIAIVCGLSGLNVVDVDDPKLIDQMIRRFGDTAIIVKTGGRGGYQAYYRAAKGIGPRDLRYDEGIAVEVKAEGNIVIVPPSRHFITGNEWEFVRGSYADIHRLPVLQIETLNTRAATKEGATRAEKGNRNNWLFLQCLRTAPHCDDFDALLDVACTRADELMTERLSDDEIRRCARSAWSIEDEGRNWIGKEARHVTTRSEWNAFAFDSEHAADAHFLYTLLWMEHGQRMKQGESFWLVTDAMVSAETIPHWSEYRLKRAITTLLKSGRLIITHKGCGRGNPSLYRLADPASIQKLAPDSSST